MPEIQFALSAHVIMKMSSFMIPPHLLFFVIVPRTFSPVTAYGKGCHECLTSYIFLSFFVPKNIFIHSFKVNL